MADMLVSVIIPLYNAEKYIGECLDSLLNQTFQNFEVIVVDDCSTDDSVKIVKEYALKFNGRLTLTKLEENSGGCALPRNKGLIFSRGEYIQFLDADDTLTPTALEELYTLAKDFNADVVYCENYYMSKGAGEDFKANVHLADSRIQRPPFVDTPTFETDDLSQRVRNILGGRFWVAAWLKLVRRSLMLEHEIFFPHICPSEDDIWTYGLIFYAKRFLRVPNVVYIRRMSETSITGVKRTPQQTIEFWLNPILLGLKALDKFMSKHEFFKTDSILHFAFLKTFINNKFNMTLNSARSLKEEIVYSTIKDEFGERLGEYDVLIPALCTILYNEKKIKETAIQCLSHKPQDDITARVDIKLMSTEGDFQIVSTSDSKATVRKPSWFQKDGTGYVIQSSAGKLEFIAKAAVDGQIKLSLKALDIRKPEDSSKRIPYWIYYTKFSVNDKKTCSQAF